MQALIFEEAGRSTLRSVPDPTAGRGEIIVRVEATTICGTDVRIMDGLKTRDVRRGHPIGHEFAGVVDVIGEAVATFSIGDPVAVHPVISCGQCSFCQTDRENLCDRRITLGYQVDGSFAEKILIPAQAVARGNVFHRPDGIDAEAACLLEPIAACIQAHHEMGLQDGSSVLIFGAGPIGLFHMLLAGARGCSPIVVVEPGLARRQIARELGAARAISPEDLHADAQFDAVVIAVGRPELIGIALRAARKGGRINLFAGFSREVSARIDPNEIHYKQLVITGATESRRCDFAEAMQLLERRQLCVDRVITHRFALSEHRAAFELARSGQGLKVAMHP